MLPQGYDRVAEPPRIFYYSKDKEFRFGVRSDTPDPKGPMAVMAAQHHAGAATYQGYRDGFVTVTTKDGGPAALWEFTWDGYPGKSARRTFDLCWTENGRQYDMWVSSPVEKSEQGRQTSTRRGTRSHRTDMMRLRAAGMGAGRGSELRESRSRQRLLA